MRILIYRLGSLGDTVLALPCFRLIRERHPDAQITVLTNLPVSGKAAPLEAILGGSGLIDAVIPYPVGLRDPRQLLALASRLREEKFDLLISLASARGLGASLRDCLFFKACGIPRLIGIPFRHQDLTCIRRPDGVFFESEAARLARRVQALGSIDLRDPQAFDLRLTSAENAEARTLLDQSHITGNFIVASIGTKTPLNDWGASNWMQLLRALSEAHPALALVLLGSVDEITASQALLAGWRGPSANLCGKTSPRISAAILGQAALFLGHDSGPMHLAAAVGTPCVAIFSARCPPGQWFPSGERHTPLYPLAFYDPRKTTDLSHQQKALASIRVEDVFVAVQDQLASAKS
jgi:heptosyltransferase-3